MRKLLRLVRVSRLKVRARISKRGKKKKKRRQRRGGIQSKIRELADRYERVLLESADERLILEFQPQINTNELEVLLFAFICVHLW